MTKQIVPALLPGVLWYDYAMSGLIKGITIDFTKQVAAGTDALNNPTYDDVVITIDNCLVAPIIEPSDAREEQAAHAQRDQVRVHLPKASNDDISRSTFVWNGKTFTVDSDSVKFQDENTPGDWDRYFRAECLNG